MIIIDIADIEPSALRKRLSSPNAMIALYDPDKIEIPRLLSYQHAVYLPYDYSKDELGKAMECAERIRDEIGTLKDMLVGDSEVMEALRRTIERIIKTRQRIFHIAGETGTGKNLVAQYIRQVCLPKNRLLVLYCDRGSLSMVQGKKLAAEGYRVVTVVGGMHAYRGKYLVK